MQGQPHLEAKLVYNYFRDYDPELGRYIQSDPIGLAGGINTYGYVGGNPVSFIDPYGLNAGVWAGAEIGMLTCGPYCSAAGGIVGGVAVWYAGDAILDVFNEEAENNDGGSCPAPDVPNGEDGYKPPKKKNKKADKSGRVPNPNGPGKGFEDNNGDVWVPTGGKADHGGDHWDVQTPPRPGQRRGKHRNVYPGGHVR